MAKVILPTNFNIADHAQALYELIRGKVNSFGTFTLRANQASTTITDQNAGPGAVVLPFPATAHAAAEWAAGTMYIPTATILSGSFVIQHANNAQADRTFSYVILGGN
jgi:hypothetical protein